MVEFLGKADPSPAVHGTPIPRFWPLERAKETRARLRAQASSPPPLLKPPLPSPPMPLHPTSSPRPHAATDTMHSAHA